LATFLRAAGGNHGNGARSAKVANLAKGWQPFALHAKTAQLSFNLNIDEGDSIRIWWGWLATTRGLARTYLNAWSAGYQLSNVDAGHEVWSLSPAEAHALWTPITRIDPADLGYTCASPFHYVSDWEGGVFQLPAGTYELVTTWTQSRPVTDGWHTCADAVTGEPMASPPSLYRPESGDWTVTIIVE